MTFFEKLENQLISKQSYLCVGLDPVWEKIPPHLPRTPEGLLEFLLKIVDETKAYAAVFKPNFAYFEILGASGMEVLQELIRKIPRKYLCLEMLNVEMLDTQRKCMPKRSLKLLNVTL